MKIPRMAVALGCSIQPAVSGTTHYLTASHAAMGTRRVLREHDCRETIMRNRKAAGSLAHPDARRATVAFRFLMVLVEE